MASGGELGDWGGGIFFFGTTTERNTVTGNLVQENFKSLPTIYGGPYVVSSAEITAVVGSEFRYAIQTTEKADSASAHGLPAWLEFDAETMIFQGAPPTPGSFGLALQTSNASGTHLFEFVLLVAQERPLELLQEIELIPHSETEARLRFPALNGKTYMLEAASDLSGFSPLKTLMPSQDGTLEERVALPGYYRVLIQE